MLKLDLCRPLLKIESFEPLFFSYLIPCRGLLLSGRKEIHSLWQMDNFLPNRKEKVAHILWTRTNSSFKAGERRERGAHISRGRLILPFKRKKVGCISRMQDPEGVCPSWVHGKAWDDAFSPWGSLFINFG